MPDDKPYNNRVSIFSPLMTLIAGIGFGITLGAYMYIDYRKPVKAQERKIDGQDYLIIESKDRVKSFFIKQADGSYVPLEENEKADEEAERTKRSELQKKLLEEPMLKK
ncbi:MAG: hypothetical protein Q8L29_03815 [archaeon]|nr:hypothetical protein [archaeon]